MEMARCMFSESKLPKKFWAETVNTAVYIRNRSPTNAVKGMTPYECLFGCLVYSHIPKDERKKFDIKTRKCIFWDIALMLKPIDCIIVIVRKLFIAEMLFSTNFN